MAYSKLHSSIVNSSLWGEPDHVRLLFITLLAMCDKDGCVYGSRAGLLRAANPDYEACLVLDPWDVLLAPSSDSSDRIRAPENEGRRIEEIPGGFRLLNFAYYRALRNEDDRREQNRRAQEKWRVSHDKPPSAAVSRDKPQKAHTEADTEADTEARESKALSDWSPTKDDFEAIWNDYPVKSGRKDALRHWNASIKTRGDLDSIHVALTNYKRHLQLNDWKKAQNGSTWFNGWKDFAEWQPWMGAKGAEADGARPGVVTESYLHPDGSHRTYPVGGQYVPPEAK